jgi:hypothetical protein
MILHLPSLDAILERHSIEPELWPAFHGFVEEGHRPGDELGPRLRCLTNYKAAFKEIVAELTKTLAHKFPPPDYQPPEPTKNARRTSRRSRRGYAVKAR